MEKIAHAINEGIKVNNDGVICNSDNFFFLLPFRVVTFVDLIFSLSTNCTV